eukprot:1501551-Amphidinium_carterae.1
MGKRWGKLWVWGGPFSDRNSVLSQLFPHLFPYLTIRGVVSLGVGGLNPREPFPAHRPRCPHTFYRYESTALRLSISIRMSSTNGRNALVAQHCHSIGGTFGPSEVDGRTSSL